MFGVATTPVAAPCMRKLCRLVMLLLLRSCHTRMKSLLPSPLASPESHQSPSRHAMELCSKHCSVYGERLKVAHLALERDRRAQRGVASMVGHVHEICAMVA